MREGFRKFAEHTTIHGIKDTLYAKTLFWKIVWFIFLFTSTCCMLYFIIAVGVDCNKEPTTTKLSWSKEDYYETPPISFCPTIWINETTAISLGLTSNLIKFLENDQTWINLNDIEYDIFSQPVIHAMYETDLASIPEFYKAIALEPKAVIACKVCTSVVQIYQMYQICYKIDYGPLLSQELNTLGQTYVTYKNLYRSMLDFSGRLVIGEGVFSLAIVNGINTRPGHLYLIQVTSKQIIQLSKRNEPCSDANSLRSIASLDIARLNCVSQKVTDDLFCRYYAGYKKAKNSTGINSKERMNDTSFEVNCDGFKIQNEDVLKNNCLLNSFVPPCKRWVFEYTFNTESMSKVGESKTDFVVLFAPIYGVEVLEEVLKYTWDSFLSNIGGQLGLWLGASFLSCFQIVYYICIEPCLNDGCRRLKPRYFVKKF